MPSTRLLLLLCLLSLSSVAHSQDRTITPVPPDSCPVTKASERPFVPSAPHQAKPARSVLVWYGQAVDDSSC